MFHVLIVLPILILLVILISILLFGLLTFIISLVGGTSVAFLVKNTLSRRLLLTGFSILSFIGLLPILPFVMAKMNASLNYISIAVVLMMICIGVLSVVGIKFSSTIKNKFGKISLIVIFCITTIIALFFIVLAPIISNLLLLH